MISISGALYSIRVHLYVWEREEIQERCVSKFGVRQIVVTSLLWLFCFLLLSLLCVIMS